MTDYSYQRPPFHPYGYASTGNGDLAFIRISKNASSSFVETLRLDDWTHASRLGPYRPFCAVRDPVDRFYSSVVETTLRARLFQDAGCFGDIVVDPEIYFEMQRLLRAERHGDFLWYVLGAIDASGPFDAHHERQVRFLEGFRPYAGEIAFFDMAKTDAVLADLLKTYPGRRTEANRQRDGKRVRARLGNLRALRAALTRQVRAQPLSPRHLLFPGGRVRFGSRAFDRGVRAFSHAVRAAGTPALEARIAEVYSEDAALFSQVRGGTPVRHMPAPG